MKEAWVKALGPSNQYAVVNILSVLWTLPVCLALEVPNFKENWDRALRKGSKEEDIYKNTVSAPSPPLPCGLPPRSRGGALLSSRAQPVALRGPCGPGTRWWERPLLSHCPCAEWHLVTDWFVCADCSYCLVSPSTFTMRSPSWRSPRCRRSPTRSPTRSSASLSSSCPPSSSVRPLL